MKKYKLYKSPYEKGNKGYNNQKVKRLERVRKGARW